MAENLTIEKPRRTIGGKAKKAGAVISSAVALAASGAPPAMAESASPKKDLIEMVANKLRNPNKLPGNRLRHKPEQFNQLKTSTVQIIRRFWNQEKNSTGWEPSCTAVKVSIPGQSEPYIMSAAHCFSELTGVRTGAFTDMSSPQNKAENYTDLGPYQYAVADPNAGLDERLQQPTALITGILISTDNRDTVLLRAGGEINNSDTPNVRHYADIPAIPLKIAEMPPLQGTPVILYGQPKANNFESIVGLGTYLGRVWITEPVPSHGGANVPAARRPLDLVGINPTDSKNDNCNFGTSGSMALLPNGTLLGNLSMRATRGYSSPEKNQDFDRPDYDVYWRPRWEKQLNVDLGSFAVLCGYTVMNSQTPHDLLDGFNHPAVDVPLPTSGSQK